MTNDDGRKPEGAPERSPKTGVGVRSGVDGNSPKRFSVQRRALIPADGLTGGRFKVMRLCCLRESREVWHMRRRN